MKKVLSIVGCLLFVASFSFAKEGNFSSGTTKTTPATVKNVENAVAEPIAITTSRTIFDPATVDPTTLRTGFEVVTIDGTKYLKATLAGWGSYTPIPQVVLSGVTKFKCQVKYEQGTSTYAASSVNTFLKFADPSWGELAASGSGSSDVFKEYVVNIKSPSTVAILQVAGQETTGWSAIEGGILYIGKIEAVDGTVGKIDSNFSYDNAGGTEIVKGGDMEDASAWTFYYNVKDAKDTLGTIEFGYTADKPAAGVGGCYRVSTYGQSATFLYQKIRLIPGHTYHWDGAFKNAMDSIQNTWLEYGLMKNQPTGGEITTDQFSYVFNLNTWMGADTLNVDTTFGEYFPFSGAKSNTFKLPETETDTEWFIVIKTGCWGDLGQQTTKFDFLFDNISVIDLTPNVVKGSNMEDPSAWSFYYNTKDAKDSLGTIQFNYTEDGPEAGEGGCYRVSTYGQSATFLYQPITLLPGHRYSWTGAFKNALDSVQNTWLEYGIMKNQPTGGEITTDQFSFVYNLNTWMGADTLNVDTTFDKYFPMSGGENGIISIPDTVSDTQWFIVIKTGCWGDLGQQTTKFDFLFDDIAVYDISLTNIGGNMEDATAWKFYYNVKDAKDTLGIHEFNYTAAKPAAGKGGNYHINTYGQSATFTYQPVEVIPGHRYQLTGAFRSTLDSIQNTWLEFGVMKDEPGGGEVTTDQFFFVYNLNTWMGKDTLNVDTTFPEYFPSNIGKDGIFLVPDTITDTQWWILIKTGCWGDLGSNTTQFDFLFDEIYLTDLGLEPWVTLPIQNVVVGTVDDAADFTGSVTMKYDVDSVYMKFNIVDDKIVAEGTAYQVDNIEVYFDMDNSKNIHWPRNGGWRASIDAAYDANDYQLRLVPGVDFATNNSARPASASIADGYNQVYNVTDNGYEFILNIAWETLLPGFAPEGGELIGFDVLVSDNDVSASDANRNQITWNSPTDKPFNDPSIFGELLLTPSGSFIVNQDTEKPTDPTNLAATQTAMDVTLTWDPSTDNRVVNNYIVFDKTKAVDTILAAETGNKFVFKAISAGAHKLGVTAVDMYGNKSAKATLDFTVEDKTSANELSRAIGVYPNPSQGLFNVSVDSPSAVKASVFNMVGEIVYKGEFINNTVIDLTTFNKGVYFLNLTIDGTSHVSKLVVK